MASIEKLITKLKEHTIKKKELETVLKRFGFSEHGGKGSHKVWGHSQYADIHIVIATHSKEVPQYQIRQIEKSLTKRGIL